MSKLHNKLKIAYIIRSFFGLMGSAASYMFPIKTNEHYDVLVLEMNSNKCSSNAPIVCTDHNIPALNRFSHNESEIGYRTITILNQFKPDIVHLFHSNRCIKDIFYLRSLKFKPKIILDFRSPIFANPFSRSHISLLCKYFFCHLFSDRIITHSKLTLPGNLPLRFKKYTEITPGVDLSFFKVSKKKNKHLKKFIYIGSLDRNRRIDILIELFRKTISILGNDLKLDIYGHGDTEKELQAAINKANCNGNVFLRGYLSQKQLSSLLPHYDAGIAFIHDEAGRSIFSKAPSLKTLEYAAAGLPIIASNTPGHLDYIMRYGFKFELFDNTFISFNKLISKLAIQGFDQSSVMRNLNCVKRFDWDFIARTKLLPLYKDLAGIR